MILNNWYVAAESDELTGDGPLGTRMLGADFVLFRDAAGQIRCLSAVCCHRGASLACGKVVEGNLACPYHGWEFEGGGQCTKIPALGADVKIPRRARVDSYPVREKYGWIWVFLGDAAEQERPPFPDHVYPEYDDAEKFRCIRFHYEVAINWERSEENSIDGAHPSFVHKAFGSRRDPTVHIVPVETNPWGAKTTRMRTPAERGDKTGAMREITAEARGKNVASTEFMIPGIVNRTDILRADGVHQVQLAARTPIDEYNTRVYLIQARNYLMEEIHDPERMAGLLQARDEDTAIVERVRPRLTPDSASADLLTQADQLETAFRKKLREMYEKGWKIDSDTVERLSSRQVFVIPSPARREDPKNWVHKAVPTLSPRDSRADDWSDLNSPSAQPAAGGSD